MVKATVCNYDSCESCNTSCEGSYEGPGDDDYDDDDDAEENPYDVVDADDDGDGGHDDYNDGIHGNDTDVEDEDEDGVAAMASCMLLLLPLLFLLLLLLLLLLLVVVVVVLVVVVVVAAAVAVSVVMGAGSSSAQDVLKRVVRDSFHSSTRFFVSLFSASTRTVLSELRLQSQAFTVVSVSPFAVHCESERPALRTVSCCEIAVDLFSSCNACSVLHFNLALEPL